MDCQPCSSKSSQPHSKGGKEATHNEIASVRQDPQGEESRSTSSLASSPNVSSVSQAQFISSGLSVRSAASCSARAPHSCVNLPSTRVDHSNYVYCVSNMNDFLQNSAPAPTAPSSSNSGSGKRGSVHEDNLSSLLPKHFSEMSQSSQQAVLEQLLSGTESHATGGKAREAPPSASGMVVSLPSHSSSLSTPHSPGLPSKNDSGSADSSNNTVVVHGSSSPDSPWSQQWGSSLLHTRGMSSALDSQRGASYDNPNSTSVALTSPELLRGGVERSDARVPSNSSYLPSSSSYLSSNLSYLAATTSNSYLPSYSSSKHQSLSYSTSLGQSLSPDPALSHLGHSHITSSALDQSEVLKHLLNSSTDAARPESTGLTLDDGGALGASKLTCSSSSCGSVHSGGQDNVTPTSGYSSASTQFSLSRSSSNPRAEGEPRAPPPAYSTNYPLNRDVLLAREALRDISLGRGTELRDHSTRGATRELRRDLSLGPEVTRRPRDSRGVPTPVRDSSAPPTADGGLSRSHPDLSRLEESREVPLSERLEVHELPGVVDLLHRENTALRLELEVVARKVSKLQKFEAEIVKMQAAHEGLVQSCSRREQLEKLARTKLQAQVQALARTNVDLREELEALRLVRDSGGGGATASRETEEALRRELRRRDVAVAQLGAHNKELLAAKERLEMEIAAQKKTLHEQRCHIEVLDSALASARLDVVSLEEEARLKQSSAAEARQERQPQVTRDQQGASVERRSSQEQRPPSSDRRLRTAAPRRDEELDRALNGAAAAAGPLGRLAAPPPGAPVPLLHIHEADCPPDYPPHSPSLGSDRRRPHQGSVDRVCPTPHHGGGSRSLDAEGAGPPWTAGDAPPAQEPTSEPVELPLTHSAAGQALTSTVPHRSVSGSPAQPARKSPFSCEATAECGGSGPLAAPRGHRCSCSCEPQAPGDRVREQDDRDRSNYTQYLSRQFNKLRDATLSKNINSKRLSYPLKHEVLESTRKVEKSHNDDQVCGMCPNPSSVAVSPPPRSAKDLSPGNANTTPPLHSYVNYCPGNCDQSSDVDFRVPEYVGPPDYFGHTTSKADVKAFERSDSFHSGTSRVKGNHKNYHVQQQQPEPCLPQFPVACQKENSSYSEKFPGQITAEPSLSNSRLKVPHVRLTPPPPSPNSSAPLRYNHFDNYALVYDTSHISCESFMAPRMSVPRGNPPPYDSHHEILESSAAARPASTSGVVESSRSPSAPVNASPRQCSAELLSSTALRSSPLTVTPAEMCQTNHPPTTSCKTCNNARSAYRKNAANLVRRASSGASLLKRKSAKLRSSFHTEVDLDESPSILSRLRKEWQDRKGGSKSTGNIPTLSDASETSICASSYLSPAASVKPPESLRFELSAFSRSLSKKKWIIQENQAVGSVASTSEGSYVMCNDHTSSPPLERNTCRPLSVESVSSGTVSLNDGTHNHSASESSLCDSAKTSAAQTTDQQQENFREVHRNSGSQNECHYYDVEMSDNDSTYDTLIIKNVSELNDSNTTVGCDCADACAVLSDAKDKTRTSSKHKQADIMAVKR